MNQNKGKKLKKLGKFLSEVNTFKILAPSKKELAPF
jgi:hypothetical protein